MLVLKGEVEQGVFVMSQALTKNSKLPSPELTAALILAERRDAAGAEKWFHAAIKSERADWHRWSEYLKWLLSNERPADARKAIDRLDPALRKERAFLVLHFEAAFVSFSSRRQLRDRFRPNRRRRLRSYTKKRTGFSSHASEADKVSIQEGQL